MWSVLVCATTSVYNFYVVLDVSVLYSGSCIGIQLHLQVTARLMVLFLLLQQKNKKYIKHPLCFTLQGLKQPLKKWDVSCCEDYKKKWGFIINWFLWKIASAEV